jgi:hypothetical protein
LCYNDNDNNQNNDNSGDNYNNDNNHHNKCNDDCENGHDSDSNYNDVEKQIKIYNHIRTYERAYPLQCPYRPLYSLYSPCFLVRHSYLELSHCHISDTEASHAVECCYDY